jgi:chromate transport protein ChrA
MQVAFASWILFALASAFTKLALLAFYKRILPSNSRVYGWTLYAAMAVVIILGFNNVFEVVFMCK